MAALKALLVGVTEYATRPFERVGAIAGSRLVSKDMPSAERDVGEMLKLLKLIKGTGRFADVTWRALTGRFPDPLDPNKALDYLDARATTKNYIIRELKWLFEDALAGDQLLFYFSGHAILAEHELTLPNGSKKTVLEEVLCPSDTDWKTAGTCIRDEDLVRAGLEKLSNGACLEVVLEACSASAFPLGARTPLKFGCFFGGSTPPAGRGAVWSASRILENSHSGPIPACSTNEIQGLFTHFFCQQYSGKSRIDLLKAVKQKLDEYRDAFNTCCAPEIMPAQTPTLYCQEGAKTETPMSGSCPMAAVGAEATGIGVSAEAEVPGVEASVGVSVGEEGAEPEIEFSKPDTCGDPITP